jgi:plastocyanin
VAGVGLSDYDPDLDRAKQDQVVSKTERGRRSYQPLSRHSSQEEPHMLKRLSLLVALAGATFAIVSSVSAGTAKDRFDLKGEVYGNSMFKIEMTNSANRDLKTIKAGTYRIKIEDKASIHDFHLVGPGVDKSTSIPGMTQTFWTVKLKRGTYKYFCDPHVSKMRGSFRVT